MGSFAPIRDKHPDEKVGYPYQIPRFGRVESWESWDGRPRGVVRRLPLRYVLHASVFPASAGERGLVRNCQGRIAHEFR